jgi:hypothetical protein
MMGGKQGNNDESEDDNTGTCKYMFSSGNVRDINRNQCEGNNKCSTNAVCTDMCDRVRVNDEGAVELDDDNKPIDFKPRYHCECNEGFKGNGERCNKVVTEKKCNKEVMDSFDQYLRKLKITNVKNPKMFAGRNAAIVEVQTAMKNWFLTDKRYTAFIEFSRKNCGAKFLRSISNGNVDINIFDTFSPKVKGPVYKMQGQKAIFLKKRFAEFSSVVIQYTKRIKSIRDAIEEQGLRFVGPCKADDPDCQADFDEVGQVYNPGKDRLTPSRDILYLMVSGDVVNDDAKEGMGDFFKKCFDPSMVKFSIWNDRVEDDDDNKLNNDFNVLEEDHTKCYVKHKFMAVQSETPLKCDEGDLNTVINSEPSYCTIRN